MATKEENLWHNAFIIECHVSYPEYSEYQLAKFLSISESAVRTAFKKYYAPVTGFDKIIFRESKINYEPLKKSA